MKTGPGPSRVTILLAALVAPCAIAHAQTAKPNILVIWGDDIGQFNVGAYKTWG